MQKLKKEIDNGDLDKSDIREKAVEYRITYYTMRNAIVNVLGYIWNRRLSEQIEICRLNFWCDEVVSSK